MFSPGYHVKVILVRACRDADSALAPCSKGGMICELRDREGACCNPTILVAAQGRSLPGDEMCRLIRAY